METYEGFLDAANELKQNVKDATRISTIDFPENLNYLKKADLDRVYNLLKSKKEALLAKVAPYMSGKTLPETNTTTEIRNNNVIASQIDVAIKEARKDAEEKQRKNNTTSLAQEDIDLAYYNALVLDKNAEVKLTEEQAFTITEAIKAARASQELLLKLNENSNM